jgi:D-3-phosphoglycerate dehydrogenase
MTSPDRILVTPRALTARGLEHVAELLPLREAGYHLVSPPPGRQPTERELVGLLDRCVGWIAGIEPITEPVLAAAASLRVISRNGTGVDNIDLAAATERCIVVQRALGANAQGVAELSIGLALCALRNIPFSDAAIGRGEWRRWPGRELAQSTVGIVGLGAVGRQTATLAGGFGASVLGYDPYLDPALCPAGVELTELNELVARSDVISLHCAPNADGSPLVTAQLLATFRPGAVLINTARSGLVDAAAALSALEEEHVSCYAFDVFDVEPPPVSKLIAHPRTITTPHIGGYTEQSIARATSQAVRNLLEALCAIQAS